MLWTSASTAANRFQLKRKLGEGGHGVVFLAFDTVLEREVALKLPRPETLLSESAKRRFLRKARACAALDHPNLVAVYDAGDAGPFCYIAEAYCDGPTLSAWLKQQTNPVDPQLAAEIVRTVADAVACAHRAGILHRDIKPANVLLEPSRGDPEGAPPPVRARPQCGLFDPLAAREKTSRNCRLHQEQRILRAHVRGGQPPGSAKQQTTRSATIAMPSISRPSSPTSGWPSTRIRKALKPKQSRWPAPFPIWRPSKPRDAAMRSVFPPTSMRWA